MLHSNYRIKYGKVEKGECGDETQDMLALWVTNGICHTGKGLEYMQW